MVQYFKANDAVEKQYYNSAAPIAAAISASLDSFFNEGIGCQVLGELLYDTGTAPLANAIPRDIFALSFSDIFTSFVSAGTVESYITVFKAIFGDDVTLVFTPGNGTLSIAISASTLVSDNFQAEEIESGAFVFYDMLTQAGEQLLFNSIQGLQSQYEVTQMLFEMVPNGVYTQITLDLEA